MSVEGWFFYVAIAHLSTMCQASGFFFHIKLIRFGCTYYGRNSRIGWLIVTDCPPKKRRRRPVDLSSTKQPEQAREQNRCQSKNGCQMHVSLISKRSPIPARSFVERSRRMSLACLLERRRRAYVIRSLLKDSFSFLAQAWLDAVSTWLKVSPAFLEDLFLFSLTAFSLYTPRTF